MKKIKEIFLNIFCLLFFLTSPILAQQKSTVNGNVSSIHSIDTHHTVMKVAIHNNQGKHDLIVVSYSGIVMEYTYQGKQKWQFDAGRGVQCKDIWCADINGNGNDEILLAMGDGTIQCFDSQGERLWQFQSNNVPMVSVCTVHNKDHTVYIACGGNDLNLYYLSNKGKLLRKISSASYPSLIKPNAKWNQDGMLPDNMHAVNFVRPIPQKDGSDILLVNGIQSDADQLSGLYQFKPMAEKPFKSTKLQWGYGPVGDMIITNVNGQPIVIMGNSANIGRTNFFTYNPQNNQVKKTQVNPGGWYRVVQPELIHDGQKEKYLVKAGDYLAVVPLNLDYENAPKYKSHFSYNDICYDSKNNFAILASAQSGGSCIHVINLNKKHWGYDYAQLNPPGKIQSILDNTKKMEIQLKNFQRPSWERKPEPIYIMQNGKHKVPNVDKYSCLKPLGGLFMQGYEDWNRDSLLHATIYEQLRDNRKKKHFTQQQVVKMFSSSYMKDGLHEWGGHGTDPFYYNPATIKKTMDAGHGKLSVWTWPEFSIINKYEIKTPLEKLIYPLAEYGKTHNGMINLRTKFTFWLGKIYRPEFHRFLSGEFADNFLPSMEETEDMSQDLTIAARLGLWESGVANQIGMRCARDNASFNRNRQFSNQELPNHFLRKTIYELASGVTFINNFDISSDFSGYMDVVNDLIGKGALYIPKRDEIVSFNPVHLSMISPPDKEFLSETNDGAGVLRYASTGYTNTPMVFNRIGGTWNGARVPVYDFSAYAAHVSDRRLNFIPSYPNGMVMITPVQHGKFAQKGAIRSSLTSHMNSLYNGQTEEFLTDGKKYYSADGNKSYDADTYYKKVALAIQKKALLLPFTVSGDKVAWVAAQTAPNHYRLTLIDGGWINPAQREANVHFGNIKVKKVTNLLLRKSVFFNNNGCTINIPCGMFVFLDVETE